MKLHFKYLFFVILSTYVCSASSYAYEYEERYIIEVGKINIGNLFWGVDLYENSYRILIKLENKSYLSSLYSFKGEYEAEGIIKNNNLIPVNYKQAWFTKKKNQNIQIIFDKGSLVVLNLLPIETEQARVNYIGIMGYSDPLTSFLNILMEKKQSKTIDGRRIYLMDVKENNSNLIKNKRILIENYKNIWTDHKKNDLEYIEINQQLGKKYFQMPLAIKIKFKGVVFNLRKL